MKSDDFSELVNKALLMYEREVRELRIMLFPEMLHRLAYLDRVSSRPGIPRVLESCYNVCRLLLYSLSHQRVSHITHYELVGVSKIRFLTGGSLLLVGDSGVGRRSSISLVAHIHRYRMVSPFVTRNYSVKHFRADLRDLLRVCGVEGEPSVCLCFALIGA